MSARFRRYFVASVAIFLPSAVFAADIPAPVYKATPAPVFSWTGFYVGANAGIGVGRDRTTATGIYTAPALPAAVTLYDESLHQSPFGAIAGAQIGYNWQWTLSYVFGVEADWQWSGQKSSSCLFGCGATTAAFFGPGGAGFNNALSDEHKLDWFGTARVRAGYLTGSSLWYATGGVAWGSVKHSLSLTSNNVVAALFAPGTSATSFTHTQVGWTVGGGVETQLWGNWSAKAEYLYVDLGSITDTFTIPGGATLPGAAFTTTTSYRVTDHIVRAGLNYKF
jgi:outer membrane immunogenic protein